jgi:hypothetical protein
MSNAPPAYWTPERQKIHTWILNDLGLSDFAEAYKGAVENLFERRSGHVKFLCHACRDIMNTMARVYKGGVAGRVQYKEHVDRIAKHWPSGIGNAFPLTPQGLSPSELTVNLPRAACVEVDRLIEEHLAGKQRVNEAAYLFFIAFLDYDDIQKIAENDIKEWKRLRQWFMDRAHIRENAHAADEGDACEKKLAELEAMLLIAADSARNRLTVIDEILQETN